jgi:hypothetical protein
MDTNLFPAHITSIQLSFTYSLRAACTDSNMLGADHCSADFTFSDMMYAELFSTHITAKCAFRTHLLSTKSTAMGVRLGDVLITTWTGDKAVETDPCMTNIALDDMDISDQFVTFCTLFGTMPAYMFPTFSTP